MTTHHRWAGNFGMNAATDRLMAENRVGDYAERGRGAIYWSEDGRHGPSPLELVRRAIHAYPDIFQPAILKLEKFDKGSLSKIVNRVPTDWMTPQSAHSRLR